MARITGITALYTDHEIVFHVYDTMSNYRHGILNVRFRTNSPITAAYSGSLVWTSNVGYDVNNFVLAYSPNANATSATVEL